MRSCWWDGVCGVGGWIRRLGMWRWFGGLWRGWWSGWGGNLVLAQEERGDIILEHRPGGAVMALGTATVEEGDRLRWAQGGVLGFEGEGVEKEFTTGRKRDRNLQRRIWVHDLSLCMEKDPSLRRGCSLNTSFDGLIDLFSIIDIYASARASSRSELFCLLSQSHDSQHAAQQQQYTSCGMAALVNLFLRQTWHRESSRIPSRSIRASSSFG